MTSFTRDDHSFLLRAVAVIIHNGMVLLQCSEGNGFYALPGGHVEWGEPSDQTIVREMLEEMDTEAHVGRLLWVIENFYTDENKKYHEIGMYYEVKLINENEAMKKSEFYGCNNDTGLFFKWFDINELIKIRLYPVFLRNALKELPSQTTRIILHSDQV
jgi:ADP-ribose pyrophosphatase YjhB (NUDIX family)